MNHPRLGELKRDGHFWEGAAPLPTFAERGVALRSEDDPPLGWTFIKIEDMDDEGLIPEQEAAIDRLLDLEPEVFNAVWKTLAPQFRRVNLRTGVICTDVEVSRLHVDGVAYMGFSIDAECHLEHGFQVVYHPTKGTFWGDWEALNSIEEADNLEAPPDHHE
jgi:hypothetical protein